MTELKENTGFQSYKLYSVLKLHFTSKSYDYFKYNGKTNTSKDTFLKRKDKYSFYRISRKYSIADLKDYFVANFVYGKNTWIGDMLSVEAEDHYKKWQKVTQSLTHNFTNDMTYLFDKYTPEEIIKVKDGQWPRLLCETMENNIHIESLSIMNDLIGFFSMWSKKVEDDVVFPNIKLKCEKYVPFIHYDKSKYKTILKEMVKEHAEA
jgi:hypothetical protein